jgi:hypothetical protein
MFFPDPDLYPSRIPDLGSRIHKQEQKRGVKKVSCHTFFCIQKFHKIVNYFIFEMLKKKNLASFQRIIELFFQKLSLSSQKYGDGIRDPSFGIRDPGSRGRITDPGSGSATLLSSILISINSCRGNQMFVTPITYV